jgi:hypothetical protein
MMKTRSKITAEQFKEGMTPRQYRERMRQNRELYWERYESFTLEPGSLRRLEKATGGRGLNVLVLAEDWCGDVIRYLPVLEHMAEAGGWNVRIFYRDDNPDLAGLWLKRGLHRAIPVFVFFDAEMCELGHLIEKPAAVYAWDASGREVFVERHPDREDAALHHSEMSPETYARYVDFMREYRATSLERWQQFFVDEVLDMLEGVECEAA